MPAIQIADLNNAKTDVDHIADIATSAELTATDRLGATKRTLAGLIADINEATDAAEALMDEATGEVATAAATATTKAGEASASAVAAAISEAQAAAIALGDFLQSGTGAVARTFTSKARDVVSVKDFGNIGAGVEASEALQAAADALSASGGDIYFPTDRYLISEQVTVSSTRPINLRGSMSGQLYNPSENPPGIIIGANIAGSMIKYTAPDSGTRAACGGGRVSGLNFYDATGGSSAPGTYTCTAALEFNDFPVSSVEDCTFHWINGSAIKGEFMVMSSIRSNRIRYCGAAGKPALYLPSTVSSIPGQAMTIFDNRLEVCHGDSYMELGANSQQCKLTNNGFEADPAVAASNQEFLTLDGNSHVVIGNHFNRNTGSQLTVAGTFCSLTANTFEGGAYSTTAVTISGNRNTITANAFASTRTGYEVDITGPGNVFNANTMYFSGAVRVANANNSVTSNIINACTATTAVLGAGNDWWIQEVAGATASGSIIHSNQLSNVGGGVTTTGGVRVNGTAPSVIGNTFNGFSGSGNGAICIRNETSNSTIGGNTELNCTTLISSSDNTAVEYFGNNNASGGTALPLTGTLVADPGDLAAGATQQFTVAVTGAAVGDFALVSFTQVNADIVWSAVVTGVSSVTVTQWNRGAGAVNLASGTIKARVLKR